MFRLARWPIEISSWRAFCLSAPGVLLSVLEITFTGVLLLEYFFNALSSCAVHARRVAPFRPLAIIKSPFDLRVDTTSDQHAHICVGFVANKSYSIKKNRALVDFNQGTG